MDKKAILETGKEAGRIAFFAAAAALISWAGTKLAGLDPSSLYAVVGTVVLRLADKWVHVNEKVPANGIAPF